MPHGWRFRFHAIDWKYAFHSCFEVERLSISSRLSQLHVDTCAWKKRRENKPSRQLSVNFLFPPEQKENKFFWRPKLLGIKKLNLKLEKRREERKISRNFWIPRAFSMKWLCYQLSFHSSPLRRSKFECLLRQMFALFNSNVTRGKLRRSEVNRWRLLRRIKNSRPIVKSKQTTNAKSSWTKVGVSVSLAMRSFLVKIKNFAKQTVDLQFPLMTL